jgi:uncharacterized protein
MISTGLIPAWNDKPVPDCVIRLGGENFIADVSGALLHPASETLIVADLHLEKGSYFAMRRQMLPPYDTAATLARLTAVAAKRRPKRIISLGDSFHDKDGPSRMPPGAMDALLALGSAAEMVFVTGNHDPQSTFSGLADCCADIRIGAVTLRHEPATTREPQIAGHLHPVAVVVSSKGALRRKCFAEGRNTLILPAFGAYTGGLNVRDRAFMAVMKGDVPRAHVLGKVQVYAVGAGRMRAD